MTETVELPQVTRKCGQCGSAAMLPERAVLGGGWGGTGVRHLYICPDCQAKTVIENSRSRVVSAIAGLLLMGGGATLLLAVPTLGGLVVGMLGFFLGGWGIVSGFLMVELRYPVTGDAHGEPRRVKIEASLAETPEEKAKEEKRNKWASFVIWTTIGMAVVVIAWELLGGADQ